MPSYIYLLMKRQEKAHPDLHRPVLRALPPDGSRESARLTVLLRTCELEPETHCANLLRKQTLRDFLEFSSFSTYPNVKPGWPFLHIRGWIEGNRRPLSNISDTHAILI
jgi:hypothetical protein